MTRVVRLYTSNLYFSVKLCSRFVPKRKNSSDFFSGDFYFDSRAASLRQSVDDSYCFGNFSKTAPRSRSMGMLSRK